MRWIDGGNEGEIEQMREGGRKTRPGVYHSLIVQIGTGRKA